MSLRSLARIVKPKSGRDLLCSSMFPYLFIGAGCRCASSASSVAQAVRAQEPHDCARLLDRRMGSPCPWRSPSPEAGRPVAGQPPRSRMGWEGIAVRTPKANYWRSLSLSLTGLSGAGRGSSLEHSPELRARSPTPTLVVSQHRASRRVHSFRGGDPKAPQTRPESRV